ncbi:probable protein phosphatase 2C 25 [Rutidosis leptorrhynchoides]|uniref:probable protein phosphatase 2C 25 n=1 Tax=Rutidosis leptorrhynchoides TaxID=125765 RepID=UPI003A996741
MCTIAISNSPVFSPSSKLSSSIIYKSSPESLTLTHSPSSCSSSPSSSFKFRLQKPPSGLIRASNEEGPTLCSQTLLKRKRPTRLDIPVASLSFCADRSTPAPVTAKDRWKEVVVEGDGYSVFCKRGKREAMEDRFIANVDFNGQNKKGFFGVFDGHGGSKAAEFASTNIEKSIENEIEKMGEFEIVEAIRQGYLNTDSDFLKQEQRGGASCVTAIINSGNLVVSNAGDCRAVVSRGGVAEALTSDHRPSRLDEKQRIDSLGGYVDCSRGTCRVLGTLAVSRGIGDRSMKQWITAEPETKILNITPEFEFLILASDGLWDKVSNQEAVDLARPFCASNDKLEAVSACKKLVELSASRGSVDDTSVMIVQLGRFC